MNAAEEAQEALNFSSSTSGAMRRRRPTSVGYSGPVR